MNEKELTKKSKFLSLVLRHEPEKIGLVLDDCGWAYVDELCHLSKISFSELDEIVEKNNKKRFEYDEGKTMIRACQGHSVEIDLKLEPMTPPEFLYHGTQKSFVDSIMKKGLEKMQRNHVHLSADKETAQKVATRRGSNYILLIVTAGEMHQNGFKFYRSTNGVWLTDYVPVKYIGFPYQHQEGETK